MKRLWNYSFDFRGGVIDSYFVASEESLEGIVGKPIYFGEVLGKHSEVELVFKRDDFVLVSSDEDFVETFASLIGSTGYNPFDYVDGEV